MERIERIKQWHISQAISDEHSVALLSIAITADGRIITKGLCIEPEHAQIMLPEIYAMAARIETQLRPTAVISAPPRDLQSKRLTG